jgi:hypothetical protein
MVDHSEALSRPSQHFPEFLRGGSPVGSGPDEDRHTLVGQTEFSRDPREEQVVRHWTRVVGNRNHHLGGTSLLPRNFKRFRRDINESPTSNRVPDRFLEGGLSAL